MRSKAHHPADSQIPGKESLGIQAASFGLRSRASKTAHHIQASAHFLDEVGPADLVVVEGEPDIVRLRGERAGCERRVLLAIEKLELRVAVQSNVDRQRKARAVRKIDGRVGRRIPDAAAEAAAAIDGNAAFVRRAGRGLGMRVLHRRSYEYGEQRRGPACLNA